GSPVHTLGNLARAIGPSFDVPGKHHHRLVGSHFDLIPGQVRRELAGFERAQWRRLFEDNRRGPV
ncbi:MAG: hypothetical protein WCE62_13910, partial [Polyangiales bacterium]